MANQKQQILEAFRDNGWTLDTGFFKRLFISQQNARIKELREAGHRITARRVPGQRSWEYIYNGFYEAPEVGPVVPAAKAGEFAGTGAFQILL